MRFSRCVVAAMLSCIVMVGLAPSSQAEPSEAGAQRAAHEVEQVGIYIEAVMGQEIAAYVEAVRAAEWNAALAQAAAFVRAQYRPAPRPTTRVPAPAPRPGAGGVGSCTGFPIPDYIIQRESGGDPNAYNASSGAIGCSQTLISHYSSGGACAGLNPYTVDGQRACTQILYNAGGLSPWSTR